MVAGQFNTTYLIKLIPTLCYCIVVAVGGERVLSGESEMSLGDLVLVLSTIRSFESSLRSVCLRLGKVSEGWLGIRLLSPFLNGKSTAAEWREFLTEQSGSVSKAAVGDPIHVRDMSVVYTLGSTKRHSPLVSADITQGSCVLIAGASGSGKATLLRVLAGVQPPRAGTVQRPAELRYRLCQEEMCQEKYSMGTSTLLECLVFGSRPTPPRAVVAALSRSFGLGKDDDSTDGFLDDPPTTLTLGQRCIVAIVRAVLSGGDVICLDGTLDRLDAAARSRVVMALAQWRAERGIPLLLAYQGLAHVKLELR